VWPDGQSSASPLYTKCPGRLADTAGRGRGHLAWPGACFQRLELLLVLEVPFLALGSAWPSAAVGTGSPWIVATGGAGVVLPGASPRAAVSLASCRTACSALVLAMSETRHYVCVLVPGSAGPLI
jgi:hypothetical protein